MLVSLLLRLPSCEWVAGGQGRPHSTREECVGIGSGRLGEDVASLGVKNGGEELVDSAVDGGWGDERVVQLRHGREAARSRDGLAVGWAAAMQGTWEVGRLTEVG